jgi:hypothetical protein
MDVYLQGKRIKLDPARSLGKGGEADVFDLGRGRALKVFKSPDHVDYQGLPAEQKAAEQRILVHQRKLREFPAQLPLEVIAPQELATDRSGRFVVGYAMQNVAPAEPLVRVADPAFRHRGVSNDSVVQLFRSIHRVVSNLHRAGVVIGDFNDLNVLVTQNGAPRFIDADSFQFGPYPCAVFTERFVDPLLCDEQALPLKLVRPYGPNADWYAFATLLMQSLLFVGPYGGIYRPKERAQRLPPSGRPLRRITVFHEDVQYPKPATSFQVLPDELLHRFHQVFERDERGVFPANLLEKLKFSGCDRCNVEHARSRCPFCGPSVAGQRAEVLVVRGEVVCKHIFETKGAIIHACVERGELRFVHHDGSDYRREDGSLVMHGALDPGLHFRIAKTRTLLGKDRQIRVVSPNADTECLACDSDGRGPAFDARDGHLYRAIDGRLFRDGEPIGDVLLDQTRIWAGETFGFGFYRASNLFVAFMFDAARRGINDSVRLPPLPGRLVDAACALDSERAWFFLALHNEGRTTYMCLVYARSGALEATAEADAGEDSWLGALHGRCATGGMLFAATDNGVARVEVRDGTIRKTRDFPDTEPFVDAGCQLFAGKEGMYVVRPRRISVLRMN